MTLTAFSLAVLRFAAIVMPAWIAAHSLRASLIRAADAGSSPRAKATGETLLAEAVMTLSVLLVASESLGLFGLDRIGPLIGTLWFVAGLSWRLARSRASAGPGRREPSPVRSTNVGGGLPVTPLNAAASSRPASARSPLARLAPAAVAVVVVSAQWSLQTANALGSGMLSFDTLWYHMPFAADFAQKGSVTAIQFTQADPFVAYYPANSELFHALGLLALRGDFLSPLLNLMWLALALLAAWCIGRPWRVQALTLTAGCLVMSLPVLSSTQPGEAFNDAAGLASLLAGVALLVNASTDRSALIVAGLALGLAVGTKLTFLVPVLCLLVAFVVLSAPRHRTRTLLVLGLPLLLTGGWWYLRNLIAVGNPFGLRLHLGPLQLPGPASPLADASQQTVASQIGHLSLWSSRFAPGLDHAFGPLWPVVLAVCLLAIIAGLLAVGDARVRALALVAALTGISYLLLPTGATGIQRGTNQFAVNLRYAMPAVALGIVLIPLIVRLRAPRLLTLLGPAFVLLLALSQLEHSLWPTQTARHGAFLVACSLVGAALWWGRALWRSAARSGRRTTRLALACGLLLAVAAGAFVAQRHYYRRRYLVGDSANPALGTIYRWAQSVGHARIALYGSVEQYPLFGARDTNAVDYLGAHTAGGGYRPIASCTAWRRRLRTGRYDYVVLSTAPTRATPVAWTAQDPAATLLLHPAADYFVFKLDRRAAATPTCA
jgi:hypothetical protein